MRKVLAAVGIIGLTAVLATPAGADRGAPGSTYPEQPDGHGATACAAVIGAPSASADNQSAVANAITLGLIIDACF